MRRQKTADIREQIVAITEELRSLYNAPDQGRCQLQIENLKRMLNDLAGLLDKDVAM